MLTITDADLALAATLGLQLEKLTESAQDRMDATDPRALRTAETWMAYAGSRARPVGRLRFTAINCLRVSHLASGVTAPEETVADALRRIAPVLRHVRTGAHDGTETVTIGDKTFERPRAITECAAAATGGDYGRAAAKSDLVNGHTREMCPACRAKLEDAGVRNLSKLPDRRGSSTAKQRSFIRRLLDEAARNGHPYLLDARDIDVMSSRGASATINELKAFKARGWKGGL
jgi:hypothetical protein